MSAKTSTRVSIGLASALVLAFGIGFLRFAGMIDTVETPPVRHADGIVALTGGAERVADAIALLDAGHADRLLVTGVNPVTTREDVARRLPGARKLVACCVDLGYRAANTVGNARETADWVRARGLHSLIVVTSNYHMPRALAEIGAELPDVDLQPYPVVSERVGTDSWWTDARRLRLVMGEYVKYLLAKARRALSPTSRDDGFEVAKRRS